MLCFSNIEVLEKVLEQYEIMEVKISCDKFSSLQLGSWKSVTLLDPFDWIDGPNHILRVWLEKNWSEVHAKVGASILAWLWRWLSLKSRDCGVC